MNWGSLILVLSLLLAVLFAAPTSGMESHLAKVQPTLRTLARQQPNESVAVIVQKTDKAGAEARVPELGGTVTRNLRIINAFAAKLPAGAVSALAEAQGVRFISLDGEAESAGRPPKDGDLVLNTYLETLNVPQAWQLGYDGSNIGIAIIDSGLSTDTDLKIAFRSGFNDISNTVNDVYGHGTHVAGIAAGNGSASDGFYRGVAPAAHLIGLKISDGGGLAHESDVVEAMQWVYDNHTAYNIRVVNVSINSTSEVSYHQSPMDAAAEILWFNGIVVVVSAGNRSADWEWDPIKTAPANDPFLITVGAVDENGSEARRDDYMAVYSANGYTVDGHKKPDIVAPGSNIRSVLSKDSAWDKAYPDRCAYRCEYFRLSGTSMAAPMVSGAVALLLQAEPGLNPDQVKYRLMTTGSMVYGDSFEGQDGDLPYMDVYDLLTTPTTETANTGKEASQLLWTGTDPVNWNSVNWASVNWASVNWASVNWASTYWGE